ncbi:hypothetical protein Hs30E_20210 [Lactococcus hodotermopsidis]|uniref:DUF4230 domain-containing protein n=1 Tax=Pseudolactococcus hodotermopsidis TaxID=2709157 RepID=A0A6A0BDE6_9LACT|nr:hypothetical protein [Lactococcus hodotermopsidis]GFH43470.1 hypothetical protein Hs30E_20210 [Lactococcus hodotermopsidis]
MKKIKNSLLTIVVTAVVIIGAMFVAKTAGFSPFSTSVTSNSSQVVRYLTKEKQIALVGIGITDVTDDENTSKIFGLKVPGTSKKTFLKSSFEAKLGIDGKNVKITDTGNKTYKIEIPKFIFIGHSNAKFEVAAEKNGVLSFTTAKVDTAEMISDLLDEKGQEKYITQYQDLLEESAKEFYRDIVTSFDEEAKLTFEFAK